MNRLLLFSIFLLGFPVSASAEEPIPELRKTAETFVSAYNDKDLEAIEALFTEDAEMVNDSEKVRFRGTDEIMAVFAESFSSFPTRKVSLEVEGVRLLTEDVAIEEGLAHFTDPEDETFIDSVPYSATLVRAEEGNWRIAHSHEFPSIETGADWSLLDSLSWIEGEWTMRTDELRMDVEITRSESGFYYLGKAMSCLPGGAKLHTELRIGLDPASETIRWWTFDEMGGFAAGTWRPRSEDGSKWLVESRGVTSSGEINSASQRISYNQENTLLWQSSNRKLDGESLPDVELRLVRTPPQPKLPAGE